MHVSPSSPHTLLPPQRYYPGRPEPPWWWKNGNPPSWRALLELRVAAGQQLDKAAEARAAERERKAGLLTEAARECTIRRAQRAPASAPPRAPGDPPMLREDIVAAPVVGYLTSPDGAGFDVTQLKNGGFRSRMLKAAYNNGTIDEVEDAMLDPITGKPKAGCYPFPTFGGGEWKLDEVRRCRSRAQHNGAFCDAVGSDIDVKGAAGDRLQAAAATAATAAAGSRSNSSGGNGSGRRFLFAVKHPHSSWCRLRDACKDAMFECEEYEDNDDDIDDDSCVLEWKEEEEEEEEGDEQLLGAGSQATVAEAAAGSDEEDAFPADPAVGSDEGPAGGGGMGGSGCGSCLCPPDGCCRRRERAPTAAAIQPLICPLDGRRARLLQ